MSGIQVTPAAVTANGAWSPSMSALKGATADPRSAASAPTPAAGFLHCVRVPLEVSGAISSVMFRVTTLSTALTASQCFIGVYSAAGTLLGKTADLSSGVFNTVGKKTAALVAEAGQSLPSGSSGAWVHIGILLNGTMPSLMGISAVVGQDDSLASPTTDSWVGFVTGGGLTALPASRAALSADQRGFWFGLT